MAVDALSILSHGMAVTPTSVGAGDTVTMEVIVLTLEDDES